MTQDPTSRSRISVAASAMMRSIIPMTVGNIVDQAGHHAAAPGARPMSPSNHDFGVDAGDLVVDIAMVNFAPFLALDFQKMLDASIVEHAFVLRMARMISRCRV